ncbi:DUF4920 domain-containing protein [Pareuzebyella sediminis]|uniref:DUF4920 domain-containing protein n=1 Tax=Pareuzebyella sediminis TaxID=2607998 RepID=UPI0011EF95D6|nr:DUF4920 domain-containing protein [Pareuzebyella sediminis]
MKRFNVLVAFLMFVFVSYAQKNKENGTGSKELSAEHATFGTFFQFNDALSDVKMTEVYQRLSSSDTIPKKFRATVTDVCQAKGCWMKLQLKNGQETMVRFKDYGFFVPMDIAGKEVIVNGLAYVESMSVEDQKHYAKDAGLAESEINKISEPKKILSFEADGVVLIQQ